MSARTKPFIGAVAFNRITRVVHPAGTIYFHGWQWAGDGDLYEWASVWP